MKTLTAKDAKYGFDCLIDLARAEPVAAWEAGGRWKQPHQPPSMSERNKKARE